MIISRNIYWHHFFNQIYICAIIYFVFNNGPLFSQSNEAKIFFDRYGPQQGFNSSQALCMGKTSDGFVWIGTDLGLVRYDGHQFKTYRHAEEDQQSLTGDYVRFLKVDRYDRIWMDAGEKLCVFDWKNKTMIYPKLPTIQGKQKRFKFIYEEKNDRMWIASNDGIFYNDGMTLNLKELKIKNVESRNYFDLAVDKQNDLWLINTEGLLRFSVDKEKVSIYKSDAQLKSNNVSDYLTMYLEDNNIWIGCWVNGLVRFDLKTYKQKTFLWQDITKFQNGILDIQTSGIKGDEDYLWLATTSGVLTFNKKTEEFTNYFSENNYDHYKINGSGFSFLPTKEDGLWIGSHKGLYRYDEKKQMIKRQELSVGEVYKNYEIGDFCLEKNNRDSIVYLRYLYANVIKYDLVNHKMIALPEPLRSYCDGKNEIYNIYIDGDERLWLSSKKDGIVIYNLKTKRLTQPKNVANFKEGNVIFKFIENKRRQLYMSDYNKIFYYDETGNEVIELHDLSNHLKKQNLNNYINNLTLDDNDNIWFVSKGNNLNIDLILKYDVANKILTELKSNDKKINAILKHIEAMHFTKDRKFIVTSQNGMVMYDEPKKEFINLNVDRTRNVDSGLDSDVWVSTDVGVSKINKQKRIVTSFTFYNSPMGQFPQPQIIKSPNGETLWIPQKGMLNVIHLAEFTNGQKDSIYLTEIVIKNFQNKSHLNVKKVLKLKHNQNEINLKFSIFNFTNSTENIYQYKLNDDDWQAMKDNELTFQELAYGDYDLKVRAYNSFGVSAANIYKLRFEIKAPFWKSGWFNSIIIMLVATFIYTIFRYREKQRLKLEKLRFNIARDLHDDLGSNLSQIKLISEIEALKNQNSKFNDVAHKLDDVMQNMKEIVWSINPKYDHLEDVVSKIQEFAIQTLEPNGINLKFNIDEIPKSLKMSPENKRNYYLIFKEAINNTVKYSQSKNVDFSIKYSGKSLLTILKDDGKGFDKNLITNGNGLKNMKARAQAMKANLTIITSMEGTSIELVI